MKFRTLSGLGLILMLLLTACGADAIAEGLSPVFLVPDDPEPTATLTASVTPLATETPSPTTPLETPTPTATSLPTSTPSPSPSPTATFPPPSEAVRVPILMYHYVSPLPPDADALRRGLTVVPERFRAQLDYLHAQGYETVLLRDLYDALSTGRPLPEQPIVLTFDDGYKDHYEVVWPMLAEYGYVGEFFVLATPAHYEAEHYLTWAEMREMSDAGMSIQGHGRDHYDLRNRSYDFLVFQILGIKEAVEAHTERPVTFFCYPSGKYDAATLSVVEGAGYLGGVTTEWGVTHTLENRFTWPRLRVSGEWSLQKFIDVLAGFE